MKKIAVSFFVMLCFVNVMANEIVFEEGKHFQQLSKDFEDNPLIQELQKNAKEKVQVLEFFSYACSWCFKLDPAIEAWRQKLPKNVDFQRIPVEFQPAWIPLTKAYYTSLDLNALNKVHSALFEAIQTQNMHNLSEESMRQFFVSKGVEADAFNKTYASSEVSNKQKWASTISRAYQVTFIPAIVVQGPKGIYMTSLRLAGSEATLIQVIDFLIKMETGIKPLEKSTQ